MKKATESQPYTSAYPKRTVAVPVTLHLTPQEKTAFDQCCDRNRLSDPDAYCTEAVVGAMRPDCEDMIQELKAVAEG